MRLEKPLGGLGSKLRADGLLPSLPFSEKGKIAPQQNYRTRYDAAGLILFIALKTRRACEVA